MKIGSTNKDRVCLSVENSELKMFDATVDTIQTGKLKYSLTRGCEQLFYGQVLKLWQDDRKFRSFFIALLSKAPCHAYRFETPSVSFETINRAFEFVLIDSPWLDVEQDQMPFSEHFKNNDSDMVEFKNLGGDAKLIVPHPLGNEFAYAHLAAFIRHAPDSQIHNLWIKTGQSMCNSISERPIWLSSAGGGVDWLHIRLDSWPKYYAHKDYKFS